MEWEGEGLTATQVWTLCHLNCSQTLNPDQLHDREEAYGQHVCLRLGSTVETETNHTVDDSPESPVQ